MDEHNSIKRETHDQVVKGLWKEIQQLRKDLTEKEMLLRKYRRFVEPNRG